MNWIQRKTQLLKDLPPAERYLVGVSGGRDSVALLHWLISLRYKRLIVCHLNHRLRGRASATDAQFVERLVEGYNHEAVGQALRLPKKVGNRSGRPTMQGSKIEFELGSANIRALARKKKMSIEAAAREARYAFFAKAAQRHGCHTIFLAHHADDLVETFLFNLMRGAGLTGLTAMRDVSMRDLNSIKQLMIVRPLLSVWRKEIDNYVREHGLKFREDATNKNLFALRNRIRHRIIPYLEKMVGRNIRQNIWRTAIIAAEEENWIESELPDATEANLSVAKLRTLPIALQRRTILKWLRAENISEIGFDVVERVRSLVDRDARIAKVNLPKDRHARRRAGKIFVE